MELINCPACGAEVSPRATACPRCGDPLTVAVLGYEPVQVIERTSKRWKTIQLYSGLSVLLGMMTCFGAISGPPGTDADAKKVFAVVAGFLLWGGTLGFIVGRVGAWWHHG